jgi:hypothetical protein
MAGVGVSNLEQLMAIEWKFVAAREAKQSLFISRLFPAKKNIYGCTPVKKNHLWMRARSKKNYLWMRTRSKKKLFMDAHPVQKKIINARPVLKKSSRAQE